MSQAEFTPTPEAPEVNKIAQSIRQRDELRQRVKEMITSQPGSLLSDTVELWKHDPADHAGVIVDEEAGHAA